MPLTPEEEQELEAIESLQVGEPFVEFVQRVRPQYWPVPPHLVPLYDLFQRMRYERIFATVSMPPRHGKTTSIGLGIGHRVAYDPACLNFYATYAMTPAADRAADFRKVVDDAGIPLVGKATSDWRTHFGGGLKETSDGGQITGYGANGGLITVDDLLRGWAEAKSDTIRESKWQWFISDCMTRAEGGSSILMVHTRWDEDDPIGRIKKATDKRTGLSLGRKWHHINLPAIHDGMWNPIDEREQPELANPLWLGVDSMNPTHQGAMEWYAMARATGELAWWALYQGVPRSPGTKIFEADPRYFFIDQMVFTKGGFRGCSVMDPAATKSTSADFSAIGTFYMTGYGRHSKMFVRRAAKKQQTVPASARWASMWQRRWRLPVVIESIGAFVAIPQMLKETEPGLAIVEFKPGVRGWLGGDKVTRSGPVSGAWEDGRVFICNELDSTGKLLEDKEDRGWQTDFISVCQSFTGINDTEDDFVDILAHAWNVLYQENPSERQGSYKMEGGPL